MSRQKSVHMMRPDLELSLVGDADWGDLDVEWDGDEDEDAVRTNTSDE